MKVGDFLKAPGFKRKHFLEQTIQRGEVSETKGSGLQFTDYVRVQGGEKEKKREQGRQHTLAQCLISETEQFL